ncbi:MAG: hypothetical protein RIR18_2213, partial [Pseudomonadota bacterium]
MNLKLRVRLLLLIAVPLLGMLWVSVFNSVEKFTLSREMGHLQRLVVVAGKVGATVHEIQKERGMSAGFLGSRGANFIVELPAQRAVTDKRLKEFSEALAGFDAAHFGPGLVNQIGEATQVLQGISEKRQAVSSLSIPGPEAIGYYTKTISTLLAIPSQVATLSPDMAVSRMASSYSAMLQAKERAGIERATLSNVFGADKFAPEMLVRFLNNAAEQSTWYGIFTQYATEEHQKFAAAKLVGPAIDEVNATKKSAIAKMNEPSLGMDAKQWFKASSLRIELMKEVEDRIESDMSLAMSGIEDLSTKITYFYIFGTLVSVLVVMLIGHLVARNILRQIGGEPEEAVAVAHAVADGKLDNTINLEKGDDNSLLASMKRMQSLLQLRIDGERKIAAENLRIRIALDNVSTGVMIADSGRNIIYANTAVHQVLQNAASDIRAVLPGFDAHNLIGQNIDMFHKNPKHQADLLSKFTSKYVANLQIGRRHMTVTANPVVTESGERVGSVAEWLDRTNEVEAEKEISDLVKAAGQGSFDLRISVDGKQGFFLDVANGLNELSETTSKGLSSVATVLQQLAGGDLTQKVHANFGGIFA